MNEVNEVQETRKYSRKGFVKTTGMVTAGAVLGGPVLAMLGCSPLEVSEGNVAAEIPALPWAYEKLDVELVRKRGYDAYFEGGCCYGAAKALIDTLRETSGGPWETLPTDMFRYGSGGIYSWGTICGALNSSLAINALASKNHADLGNELMGWYTLFPFPSDKHEAYCKIPNQITTVANSPLCHVSVSTWVNANDPKARVNEPEKAERCAKVTGDTAAHMAQLLNDNLESSFAVTYAAPEAMAHCMSCHQGKDSMLDNQQGKMNCLSCHDDHTKQ